MVCVHSDHLSYSMYFPINAHPPREEPLAAYPEIVCDPACLLMETVLHGGRRSEGREREDSIIQLCREANDMTDSSHSTQAHTQTHTHTHTHRQTDRQTDRHIHTHTDTHTHTHTCPSTSAVRGR